MDAGGVKPFTLHSLCARALVEMGCWFVYRGVWEGGGWEEEEEMFSCPPSLAANCPAFCKVLHVVCKCWNFFGASREALTFCLEAINYLDKESRTYPINGSYCLDLSLQLICYELMSSSFCWATSELELLIGFPGEKWKQQQCARTNGWNWVINLGWELTLSASNYPGDVRRKA